MIAFICFTYFILCSLAFEAGRFGRTNLSLFNAAGPFYHRTQKKSRTFFFFFLLFCAGFAILSGKLKQKRRECLK
jgi:hypothetical protein